MSSKKPATPTPNDDEHNDDEDISFIDENGTEFFAWPFSKINHDRAGPPQHSGNMKIIRTAVMAESRLAIEKLIVLDVRPLLPDIYDTKERKAPDRRNITQRRQDAEELVALVHDAAQENFRSKCGFSIGYSIESIKKLGPRAVNEHYANDTAPGINRFLQDKYKPHALDSFAEKSDIDLASNVLDVISALLTAWAKQQEIISFQDRFYSQTRNRYVGRPPNGHARETLIQLESICYSSKIDFDDAQILFYIATHGGINPAELWQNVKPCRMIFECNVILGKIVRGIILNSGEVVYFNNVLAPFIIGQKMPQTEEHYAICRQIGLLWPQIENITKREGRISFLSDPELLGAFRGGAKLIYIDGGFGIIFP